MQKKKKWLKYKRETFFPSIGISINGQLIGAKKPQDGKLSTYFGKLGFYFQSEDMKIEVSTENITLSHGSHISTLSWSDTARTVNSRQVLCRLSWALSFTQACTNKSSLQPH